MSSKSRYVSHQSKNSIRKKERGYITAQTFNRVTVEGKVYAYFCEANQIRITKLIPKVNSKKKNAFWNSREQYYISYETFVGMRIPYTLKLDIDVTSIAKYIYHVLHAKEKWDPQLYLDGIHTITAEVNRHADTSRPFGMHPGELYSVGGYMTVSEHNQYPTHIVAKISSSDNYMDDF